MRCLPFLGIFVETGANPHRSQCHRRALNYFNSIGVCGEATVDLTLPLFVSFCYTLDNAAANLFLLINSISCAEMKFLNGIF